MNEIPEHDPVRRAAIRSFVLQTARDTPQPRPRRVTLIVALAASVLVIGGVGTAVAATNANHTGRGDVQVAPTIDSTAPAEPVPTATPGAPAPAGTPTPIPPPAPTMCSTSQLSGAVGPIGGAAGTETTKLILTNTGQVACTLQGWPGVSYVGDGNGTQIGPAATFDRTQAAPTVTLQPAGQASAPLRIFGTNGPDCGITHADGFRIYPPGQKASLFVKSPTIAACSTSPDLEVGPLN